MCAQLNESADNPRNLRNQRARMAKIRVFAPACGSVNVLFIADKKIRGVEAAINQRRN